MGQRLIGMLSVHGHEVDRAQHGVVGQDGGAEGVGNQLLAHVGAPNGLGGQRPALRDEAGLVGGAFERIRGASALMMPLSYQPRTSFSCAMMSSSSKICTTLASLSL